MNSLSVAKPLSALIMSVRKNAGRIARTAVGTSVCVALSACSLMEPDENAPATHEEAIAACEAFISAGLLAPSTYKRTDVRYGDTPISVDDFAALIGETDKNGPIYRGIGNDARDGLKLREMFIEGEAENEFGVPIPRLDRCVFRMSGTEYQSRSWIKLIVSSAISNRDTDDLLASGIVPGIPAGSKFAMPRRPCCI